MGLYCEMFGLGFLDTCLLDWVIIDSFVLALRSWNVELVDLDALLLKWRLWFSFKVNVGAGRRRAIRDNGVQVRL